MIDWFLRLPWALIAVIVMGAFILAGLAGLSLVRRFVLPRLGPAHHQNEVTGFLHHGVVIIYGLAVALLAIAVWENYAEVEKIVANEAVAIGTLYRDGSSYPEPTRTRIRTDLITYTDQVIHEAWPLMRKGIIPSIGVAYMDRLQADLYAFEPATEGQKALHQEALRAFNALNQARRLRLDCVKSGVPGPMWAVVVFGGLITLASAFFFHIENLRVQRVMVVFLAGTIGLVLFLVIYYDQPFRGSHGIKPEAYELIYEHLMRH